MGVVSSSSAGAPPRASFGSSTSPASVPPSYSSVRERFASLSSCEMLASGAFEGER